MNLRGAAREIFLEALASLELGEVIHRKLRVAGPRLVVGWDEYDLGRFTHVALVAVGKAAVPMAEGVMEMIGPLLTPEHRLEGVVVGTSLPADPDARLRYRLGSHPLPDRGSVEAADEILALLSGCTERSLVLFLISGGSSAMVERPLGRDLTVEQVAGFYRALIHSGLTIAEMNALRKHLSAVKGGRLAVAAGEATMCTLLVSDVQPGMPDVIGSGLSLPDASGVEDCRRLMRTRLAGAEIDPAIRAWFEDGGCPETPKAGERAFAKARWHMLLSSDDLCEAAGEAARRRGFQVEVDLRCDEWEYREAAAYLLNRLEGMESSRPVCLVSAGELTVEVRGEPGSGGRNQQFALECARRLAGSTREVAVLSAGSDGVDGNSPAAGAVVDSSTAERAERLGFGVDEALARFDAYPLFKALGDAIETGPSGNNVRDLRVLLAGGRSIPASFQA